MYSPFSDSATGFPEFTDENPKQGITDLGPGLINTILCAWSFLLMSANCQNVSEPLILFYLWVWAVGGKMQAKPFLVLNWRDLRFEFDPCSMHYVLPNFT